MDITELAQKTADALRRHVDGIASTEALSEETGVVCVELEDGQMFFLQIQEA
jgi:hypothetical protein